MSIAIVILLITVVVVVIFFTNIGGDYSKKTDQQLLQLWPLHEKNIRAAKVASPQMYKKALEKAATLTNEMKKRGLLQSDSTFESDALELIARKLFSQSIEEIKRLAKSNDAKAAYQLGMIFHAAKEPNTSIQYLLNSANLGYADAQFALGWAFMTEGSGVTRNACDAIKWFKIATEQGHVEAAKALDVSLKSFSKVEADTAFSEAEKWLAQKNSANAIKSGSSRNPVGEKPCSCGIAPL